MTDGAALIAAERARQIGQEGWTPEHDAGHSKGELIAAAMCYAACADEDRHDPLWWPWDERFWKPGTPIRMLVKAGALICAEIDRRIAADRRSSANVAPTEEP